jgi:hypothetical protein
MGRSRWPCGLRRRSAAAWLLGSRLRSSLRAWMFFSCVCCMLCRLRPLGWADRSFRGVLPNVCISNGVWSETSKIRRPRPELGCCVTEKKITFMRSWVNVVGQLSRQRLGQLRNRGSIPARSKIFCLFSIMAIPALWATQPSVQYIPWGYNGRGMKLKWVRPHLYSQSWCAPIHLSITFMGNCDLLIIRLTSCS